MAEAFPHEALRRGSGRRRRLVRTDHLRYPGEALLAFDQRDPVQRQ
ncbi:MULTISPECIES: hypothetical protein [unclassified Streptomyces]